MIDVPHTIKRPEEPRHGVCIGHIGDPGVPCSVNEAIAQANDHVDGQHDRPGRVDGHDHERSDVA